MLSTQAVLPTLGEVKDTDFHPPINVEFREAYSSLQQRLDNLRNWRSIDDQPLNLSLLARPISPRQLQLAALSGIPPTRAELAEQGMLPYTFDTALTKAKAAVENLMYFGDLVNGSLYRQDQQAIEELHAKLAFHVVEKFEVGGQKSLIDSLNKELHVLMKEKEEVEKYKEWYTRFGAEIRNEMEEQAHRGVAAESALNLIANSLAVTAGSIKMAPTIFGFSNGGFEPEGIVEGSKEALELLGENLKIFAESDLHMGQDLRRQQENEMKRDATSLAVEKIQLSIDRLIFDIGEETSTLEVLKQKSGQAQALVDFQARRSTNADFFKWYVGHISSLYDSAFDITVRFCRLAERAYQSEIGDPTATFLNPAWDARYHGLFSGQSLMLDLQRMDFAFMKRFQPPGEGQLKVSLNALNLLYWKH